jgi:hypothetical protein
MFKKMESNKASPKLLKQLPIIILAILFIAFTGRYLPKLIGNAHKIPEMINDFQSKDKIMIEEMAQKDSLISILRKENETTRFFYEKQYSEFTLQIHKDSLRFARINKMLKETQIKLKDVERQTSFTVNSSGTLNMAVQKLDTLKRIDSLPKIIDSLILINPDTNNLSDTIPEINLNDTIKLNNNIYAFRDSSRNLRLDGQIDLNTDSIKINYEYHATYDLLFYEKNVGLFRKPQAQVVITNNDPNADISLSSIKMKRKQPKGIIGVGYGTGFSFENDKAVIRRTFNVGFYYPLIKIY